MQTRNCCLLQWRKAERLKNIFKKTGLFFNTFNKKLCLTKSPEIMSSSKPKQKYSKSVLFMRRHHAIEPYLA